MEAVRARRAQELNILKQRLAEISAPYDPSEVSNMWREVGVYILQVLENDRTIDDLIQLVINLQQSPHDPRKQLRFHMIFQKLIPRLQRLEQHTTKRLDNLAALWGQLIKQDTQFWSPEYRGYKRIAVSHIMINLYGPANTKTFEFGAMALEHFADQVVEWPPFCRNLQRFTVLRSEKPLLYNYIKLQYDLILLQL